MKSPIHHMIHRVPANRSCGARLQVLAALLLAAAAMADAWAGGPWRADASNTAGWEAMSPAERVEHQRRMRGFRSVGKCAVYQDAQHRRWLERGGHAEAARREAPAGGCAQLSARGQLK